MEATYDDPFVEAAYKVCLDITVRLSEAGFPPYKWGFEPDPLTLSVLWPSGASVKYILDKDKTPEELIELILDGELETEFIHRPAPPSKRFINKIKRATKQRAKAHHKGFRPGKQPKKKKTDEGQ